MLAPAITGGEVTLQHAVVDEMEATVQALRDAGVIVEPRPEGLYVAADGPLRAITLSMPSNLPTGMLNWRRMRA